MLKSLTINVPNRDSGGLELLKIEQDEWNPYVGSITISESIGIIADAIYSRKYQSKLKCGVEFDTVVCGVSIYPYIKGLEFEAYTSHGSLALEAVSVVEISENINFRLSNRASSEFPVIYYRSVEWNGQCFDAKGNVINNPNILIDERGAYTDIDIYGSAKLLYGTTKYRYLLSIPKRYTSIDNFWTSVVYGVYEGGETFKKVEMPPGIEVFNADPDATCGKTILSVKYPENKPNKPTDDGCDRKIIKDYCSQNVISDVIS